jgi:hypothetical protein
MTFLFFQRDNYFRFNFQERNKNNYKAFIKYLSILNMFSYLNDM